MFRAYGAALIDKEGTIQVKSDAMKQFLEFAQKMVKFYPDIRRRASTTPRTIGH